MTATNFIDEDAKSKPHWCPQDVWHDTGMEFDKLYDAEPDIEGGCEIGIRTMAAYMVMAERERAAQVCERLAEEFLSPEYSDNQPITSFSERFACASCAAAIRDTAKAAPRTPE